MVADAGVPATPPEVRRAVRCTVCRGDWKRCRLAVCPFLAHVRGWFEAQAPLRSTNLFGASPPSAFVGSWNYPRVVAGPLVPPLPDRDTSVMDAPETWHGLDVWDILRFRLSLVRGKAMRRVVDARRPDRILEAVQEEAMAARPVDTELWLEKPPRLEGAFGARAAPTGPSADVRKVVLADNPSVPRPVERAVGDTDLRAAEAVAALRAEGIGQSHITRVFSVGLLGLGDRRRLVPTEWSITAVDDLLGRRLREEVLAYPWTDDYRVFGHTAWGNNVQILLLPTPWMYEALEAWHVERNPLPAADHEFHWGRKAYPTELTGAYHAVRLPILEYLQGERRQAGAIAFLEVYADWIPLGVWRFRELARAGLARPPARFPTLADALDALRSRLRLPLPRWLQRSTVYRHLLEQRRLDDYGLRVGDAP